MDVFDRIEKMLIAYLADKRNIIATKAHFGDTEGPYNDGCDTCGYGGTGMTFEICYVLEGEKNYQGLYIEGDPLGFLPTLLEYDAV